MSDENSPFRRIESSRWKIIVTPCQDEINQNIDLSSENIPEEINVTDEDGNKTTNTTTKIKNLAKPTQSSTNILEKTKFNGLKIRPQIRYSQNENLIAKGLQTSRSKSRKNFERLYLPFPISGLAIKSIPKILLNKSNSSVNICLQAQINKINEKKLTLPYNSSKPKFKLDLQKIRKSPYKTFDRLSGKFKDLLSKYAPKPKIKIPKDIDEIIRITNKLKKNAAIPGYVTTRSSGILPITKASRNKSITKAQKLYGPTQQQNIRFSKFRKLISLRPSKKKKVISGENRIMFT